MFHAASGLQGSVNTLTSAILKPLNRLLKYWFRFGNFIEARAPDPLLILKNLLVACSTRSKNLQRRSSEDNSAACRGSFAPRKFRHSYLRQ